MLLPIFHENKYTIEEFDQICQEAKNRCIKFNAEKNRDEYSIYDLYEILTSKYGFENLKDKLLSFNVNDSKAAPLKDDKELKYILDFHLH